MLVTVAIPTYNSCRTLPSAIRSLLAQTYANWECLILDDGSNDGTKEFLQRLSDPRFRLVLDGTNKGLPFRLNQATGMASGDLLFRMDSDDIMHPDRIAKQVSFLSRNPEVDLVGSAVAVIDSADKILGVRGLGPVRQSSVAIFQKGLFVHPTVAGRRAWFENNPYNEAYRRAQDFELWCRTSSHLRADVIQEPLLFYRDGFSSAATYTRNAKFGRKIIWKLGPAQIGLRLTLQLMAERWFKQIAHRAMESVGLRERWIARRASPLSRSDALRLEKALTKVLSTRIPGVDSAV